MENEIMLTIPEFIKKYSETEKGWPLRNTPDFFYMLAYSSDTIRLTDLWKQFKHCFVREGKNVMINDTVFWKYYHSLSQESLPWWFRRDNYMEDILRQQREAEEKKELERLKKEKFGVRVVF